MQAIFMVGEQRSGSNLLRLILNESKSIAAPHPPHILQRIMPLLPIYGNLSENATFDKLADDVCQLIELNPVPWDKVKLNRKEVRKRCNENSLVAVFGAVMDIYAEAHSASAWMCKSMQNIRWADEINTYFNSPKYIYLYRDPRDVTLSFKKAVIGDKHPYIIAQKWLELQNLCIAEMKSHDNKHIIPVSYESLVQDPEETVKNLCEFLGISFSRKMLNYHKSKEAERSAKSSTLWENLRQPIQSNNSKKFLKELSVEEIKIVESVTGEAMDILGYQREFIKKGDELIFSEDDINYFKQENEKSINIKNSEIDPDDLKRRKLQTGFINNISQMAHI